MDRHVATLLAMTRTRFIGIHPSSVNNKPQTQVGDTAPTLELHLVVAELPLSTERINPCKV